jgi:hypothetical protein
VLSADALRAAQRSRAEARAAEPDLVPT